MTDENRKIAPLSVDVSRPLNVDRSRRRLIKGIAASVGAGAAASYLPSSSASGGIAADDFSDIEHIVVVMQENRSFDHILGWVPGADGVQGERWFSTDAGQQYVGSALRDTQNFSAGDPDHSYEAARKHFNGGAMDGFLRTQDGDQSNTFPIDYFARDKVPFFSGCADYFTIGDRYFTGFMGPTWPNRIYMHSGQTDRMSTGAPPADHPGLFCQFTTIWDRARDAGVSHKYYYSDIPYSAIWGGALLDITRPFQEFLNSAADGTLPAISYVDSAFIGEALGLSNDDHPIADIHNGQAFLNTIYNALRTGPKWANTLLVINYDEWGGFADHVAPPMAPVADFEANLSGAAMMVAWACAYP